MRRKGSIGKRLTYMTASAVFLFRREVEGVEMLLEMDVYRFEARLLVKGTGETRKEAIEDAVASVADPKLKLYIMNYYPQMPGGVEPVKEALH